MIGAALRRTVIGFALALALLLAGCVLLPSRFGKPSVKVIGLVETPELVVFENHPRFTAHDDSLDLAALIGQLFGRSRRSAPGPKAESGEQLTQELQPRRPRLNAVLLDTLEQRLIADGYEVERVPASVSAVAAAIHFDLLVDVAVVRAGYGPDGDNPTYPFVYVSETVRDASGARRLDQLLCSGNVGSDITPADTTIGINLNRYEMEDEQEVLSHPRQALDGMYAGVRVLAAAIASDFRR